MNQHPYEPTDAQALTPLLDSIGRELDERGTRLLELEARIEELRGNPHFVLEFRRLEGEAANHRLELRHCREELERLGCKVVGTAPLTVRIPTREGDTRRSQVWQQRQPTNG
jgi:hypothetical protein